MEFETNQRKPLILSTYYKLEESGARTDVIFAVPVFRIPGIIEITDTQAAAKYAINDVTIDIESRYDFIMMDDSKRYTYKFRNCTYP